MLARGREHVTQREGVGVDVRRTPEGGAAKAARRNRHPSHHTVRGASQPRRMEVIPSTAVYATKDKPIPLKYAEFMVKRAQGEEAREGGVRAFVGELAEVYMDCGHCAILLVDEKVKELGKILVAAAEES